MRICALLVKREDVISLAFSRTARAIYHRANMKGCIGPPLGKSYELQIHLTALLRLSFLGRIASPYARKHGDTELVYYPRSLSLTSSTNLQPSAL